MPPPDFLTSDFNAPPATFGSSVPVTPQVTHQETTANLANGASIDFDFNIDANPLFDMFVASNVDLIVRVFVRQSAADIYRQLGVDYLTVALSPIQPVSPFTALRVPGSQARIRLLNSSGAASTTLSAQVHSRSI